ncbi:unnamed protein product [Prorocentrum cordatum]|uniref:Uncharacterized protein n=1 Tax=Prorocentrum cordatum TaxID=2364126 RepID=A0ABN9SRR6_9DINO|nr:unnamed protein product [Polarella glacialis]
MVYMSCVSLASVSSARTSRPPSPPPPGFADPSGPPRSPRTPSPVVRWSPPRTPSPLGRRAVLQTPPRAPGCFGHCPQGPQCRAKAQGLPRSPSPRRAAPRSPPRTARAAPRALSRTRSSPEPGYATPVAKAELTTPPPAPLAPCAALKAEIAAAVRERSALDLKLALHRGHCCAGTQWCREAHHVSEAVRRGHCGTLEVLLEAGSEDVNEECGGRTPLQRACEASMFDGDAGHRMAELLLRRGADPCGRGGAPCGGPPLHEASARGSLAVVRLLLRHGADPCAPGAGGLAPLHAACQGAPAFASPLHLRAAEALLRGGACPVAGDALELSPLAYAAEGGLRRKLSRAERWWTRRSLALACRATVAPRESDPPDSGPGRLLHGVLAVPDVTEAVLALVCGAAALGK